MAGYWDSIPEIGKGFLSSLKGPNRRYGPPIPIHYVPGALSMGGKAKGSKVNHFTPTNAYFNARSYASNLPYVFMARCLIKQRYIFRLGLLTVMQQSD
jgi:hypothetical protein